MKILFNYFAIGILSGIAILCQAQQATTAPPPTPYSIVSNSRTANSRVWQRTTYELSPSGQVIPHIHHYTEVATGLNFKDPTTGQWAPSKEEIDILPDGTACGANCQHQCFFPNDVYNGVIEVVTPDGLELRSQPVGLFYDNQTNMVLIGSLTNSIGVLATNNQVIYPDAFTGIDADLRYTYRKGGFEQEVVLRQQLPPPEAFGLDSGNTRLEMITEFFNTAEPEQSTPVSGPDGLSDVTLTFGSMKMVRGKAFSIGDSSLTSSGPAGIPVYKSWEHVGNRTFLVETLPFEQIVPDMNRLPAASATAATHGVPVNKALMARILPAARTPQTGGHRMRMAEASWRYKSGVILDYTEVLGSETNFIFQGDDTYLVSGPLYLWGTTTIEGGTVIKYTYDPYGLTEVALNGPVNCETASYNKAICTASDDNSVGEIISGSSGNPNGYYSSYALLYYNPPYSVTLDNLEINYSWIALSLLSGGSNVIRDVQFVNNNESLYANGVTTYLENALMYCPTTNDVFIAELNGSCTIAENLTADGGNGLWVDYTSDSSFAATNCLFTGLATLNGAFIGAYNYTNIPYTNVFQTAGGGSHYLADTNLVNEHIRGAGTVNIDPALLADITNKTTWPPMVFSNETFSVATNFGPQALRDDSGINVDIGYHYSILDYVFGGCDLHTNLTFSAGTAVGWFQGDGSYSGEPYSISLENGANLSFNGNATQPCYFANYVMVQEGGNGNWTDSGWMGAIMFNGSSTSQEPQLSGDFTKWTDDSTVNNIFRDSPAYGAASFKNCEFYNGSLTTYEMQYLNFTNCLFFRDCSIFWDQDYALSFDYENCTFYNGALAMVRQSGQSPSFWSIENCSFDGTAFGWNDNYNGNTNYTLFDYNAYNTNNLSWENYSIPYMTSYGTLETLGFNDVMVTNYNWESSWFGDFYLPQDSPLIEKGSTNANFIGLYHFTTQTNQIPEGTNVVDIGYHYVATDSDGNPLDSNGDGIPDYLEDPLGNGQPYDGTNWALTILIQPTNQTVIQGSNATFSVTAGGVPPLNFQWYWDGTALSDAGGISGSGSATLNLNATLPAQTGSYYVVVTNNFGSITSDVVMLTVTVQASQIYPPADILPPDAYWNVTDISDPAQPVSVGELQAPFSEPNYPANQNNIPPSNTPWHTNTTITVTEAYGTTLSGGIFGKGTVFKIDPAGDGAYPSEMVLSGNVLYGTTVGIGGSNSGTVFAVHTDGSGFTNLFSFTNPMAQGSQPEAGLVLCGNTLYGTTEYGGQYGYGTVFSINTNGSGFNILYNFGTLEYDDGAYPCAKLVLSGGMLYGTTSGGGNGYGTVFEVSTNSSDNTNGDMLLYKFIGDEFGNGDGANPQGELLLSDGVLYGTTVSGGANNAGTVFSISTNAGSEDTIVYSFGNTNMPDDGTNPCAGLVLSSGTLYGTTTNGGAYGNGAIFEVSTNPSDNVNGDTILHSFSGQGIDDDGAYPYGKLILFSNTLYGTTFAGGTNNDGTVFSINTNGSYTELYSFRDGADGQNPETALTLSGNALFGTTRGDPALAGGPNYGTIFSVSTNGANFTVLDTFSTAVLTVIHPFSGINGDGAYPCSQLAISGSTFYGIPTTVYGTTSGGGTNDCGTVFKVNTDGSGFADLYEFTGGSDGAYPETGLLISGNTLYGTTASSIFKINTDGSDFVCLTNVSNASQLVLSWSGDTLYGTTTNGGTNGYGMVFSINTDGSGFTDLHAFAGGANGAYPNAGLELSDFANLWQNGSTVGTLFGTTYSGGISNKGTIFSINTDGSEFTPLYSFTGGNDGAYPEAGLLATNNNIDGHSWHGANFLYGTTASGGSNGDGTIFGIGLGGTGFTNIYDFGGTNGAGVRPEGRLALLGSTTLCGTTSGGGAYTNGTIFSINTDGSGFTDFFDFDEAKGDYPCAGLTLPVVDNPESIWSVDTTLNVSSGESNVECTIYIDNYAALFVNGVLATNIFTSFETANLPLASYIHPGENDIRVVIGGDEDLNDYFTMFVTAEFGNVGYGTTYGGGSHDYGTVFEFTTAGNESVLHSFSETPDGANPIGDLILSGTNLYGTTQNGNSYYHTYGTIFSINTDGSNFLVLHTFTDATNDGANPYSGLFLSGTNLYGTTYAGGANGDGTVFSIGMDGSNFQILHSFTDTNSNDGANPQAGLILSGCTLYGTTWAGGARNAGTVFSLNTNGSDYQMLFSFGANSDGIRPQAGLVLSGTNLYGTTSIGGNNHDGTVFSISTNGLGYTNLYSFSAMTNSTNFDGANPAAGLVLSGSTLYGTTEYGGTFGYGTLFSIGIDVAGFTNLLSFGGSDSGYGQRPQADLEIMSNTLYGTTYYGGAANDSGNGNGMVFSISTNGTGFINLYDFANTPDGASPEGGLCFP